MKRRLAFLMWFALCAATGTARAHTPDTLLASQVLALDAEVHALERAV